ncbi:MAG: transcriptional repressor [Bacteroidota bacterium]
MERTTQLLKDKNLRVTVVRTKVLDIFIQAGKKALANADIERQFEQLDRITLYRTLRSFEEKGLIHQVHDGTGTTKYAICAHGCTAHVHHDEHPHFHCTSCGKTVCLDTIALPEMQLPEGYQLTERQVILAGRCAECS